MSSCLSGVKSLTNWPQKHLLSILANQSNYALVETHLYEIKSVLKKTSLT